MVKQLVKLVFEQAKNETPNVSKTGLSKHISKKIEEKDISKIFSYKTFTRYYDKYVDGKKGVIENPQPEIIEELCKYLGYENYQDFVKQHKGKYENLFTIEKINKEMDVRVRPFRKVGKNAKKRNVNEVTSFSNRFLNLGVFMIVLLVSFWGSIQGKDYVNSFENRYKKSKLKSEIYYSEEILEENIISLESNVAFYKNENFCFNMRKK